MLLNTFPLLIKSIVLRSSQEDLKLTTLNATTSRRYDHAFKVTQIKCLSYFISINTDKTIASKRTLWCLMCAKMVFGKEKM